MSVKPLLSDPSQIKDAKLKVFKTKTMGLLKAAAKKHTNADTAIPFYFAEDFPYPEGADAFLTFGKIKAWMKYAKDNKNLESGVFGYMFLTPVKGGLMLNLLPVKGKLKSKGDKIAKALKPIFGTKVQVSIVPGDHVENADLENKTEAMPETVPTAEDEKETESEAPSASASPAPEKAEPTKEEVAAKQAERIAKILDKVEELLNLMEKFVDVPEEFVKNQKQILALLQQYLPAAYAKIAPMFMKGK